VSVPVRDDDVEVHHADLDLLAEAGGLLLSEDAHGQKTDRDCDRRAHLAGF
jgi:hypothetical protein